MLTYSTDEQQFDYIILSDYLKKKLNNMYIERRGLYSRKIWDL